MMNKKHTFVIATNNNNKLKEMKRILKPLNINAISAKEAGFVLDDVEETGKTFAENALIKAKATCKKTNMVAIADDSGLCVDILNGSPGIYSARYAGENATDKDNIEKLLKELKGVPLEKRKSHFECAVCCVFPNEDIIEESGICKGKITLKPIGNDGFGYDPVFLYNNKTFAQLPDTEKDLISHRGKALVNFKKKLEKYLEEKHVNK